MKTVICIFLLFLGKDYKEIEIFLKFSTWPPSTNLDFKILKPFGHSSAREGEYALPREISSKLVKSLQRYRKILNISLVWHENGYLHFFSLFVGKE